MHVAIVLEKREVELGMSPWRTYIAVDYFHFSCKAHVWSVSFWSEVSPLLSCQICVYVLLGHRQ